MGEHKLECSKSEKYLGDWNEEGKSAGISETITNEKQDFNPQ